MDKKFTQERQLREMVEDEKAKCINKIRSLEQEMHRNKDELQRTVTENIGNIKVGVIRVINISYLLMKQF